MENASKALVMAGAIVIGILLVTIMVYFFSVASGLRSSYTRNVNDTRMQEFNTKFLKYNISRKDYEESNGRDYVTIHDIISLANYAREYNANFDADSENHIKIYLLKDSYNYQDITTVKQIGYSDFQAFYNDLIKNNLDTKFTCGRGDTGMVEFNETDGRIKKMVFYNIKEY